MIVREFVFGMPAGQITQEPTNVRELTWEAIWVAEDGGPPPPPPPEEFAFPWWLVGVGAAAAVAIRTHHIMKKEKHS
jgi:hypothetical protein